MEFVAVFSHAILDRQGGADAVARVGGSRRKSDDGDAGIGIFPQARAKAAGLGVLGDELKGGNAVVLGNGFAALAFLN